MRNNQFIAEFQGPSVEDFLNKVIDWKYLQINQDFIAIAKR